MALVLVAPGAALAAPAVTITEPAPGAVVRGKVYVYAQATPGSAVLTEVVASVGGVSLPLQYCESIDCRGYRGTIDLTSTPWGAESIGVTAKDAAPSQLTAEVAIVHDEYPRVTPIELRSAYVPTVLHVRAQCTDDGPVGCSTFELRAGPPATWNAAQVPTILASSASGVIDQNVDLSAFDGQRIQLYFNVADSRGQGPGGQTWGVASRPVVVTDSPPLCVYAPPRSGAGPYAGSVIDADAERVLYGEAIVDRISGSVTTLPSVTLGSSYSIGVLLPGGAMLGALSGPYVSVFLPDGTMGPSGGDVRVRGPISLFGSYAAVTRSAVFDTGALTNGRQLLDVGGIRAFASVNPATGEICNSSGGSIALKKPNGTARAIAVGNVTVKDCATDGGNVVYRFTTPGLPGPSNHFGLAMLDKNGAAIALVPEGYADQGVAGEARSGLPSFTGYHRGYDTAGEWVVWFAGTQIFRRSPAGVIAAASPPAATGESAPRILGMRPDGELVLFDPVAAVLHEVPAGEVMGASTLLGPAPYDLVYDSDVDHALASVQRGTWVFFEPRHGWVTSAYARSRAGHPFECLPSPSGGADPDAGADASVPGGDAAPLGDAAPPPAGPTPPASERDAGRGSDGSASSGATSPPNATSADPGANDELAGEEAGGCTAAGSGAASGSLPALVAAGAAWAFSIARRRRRAGRGGPRRGRR